MGRIEKTVFISYRRTNVPWALAIYQNLTYNGYDVFFDYESIPSGSFEKVILENIRTRAHFLIILTPSALERCKEPRDWLRREIETAMDERRNIVPLMLEGFDFGSPLVKEALTGKLASLNAYNGLRVYSEYFFPAMEKLRDQFLKVELSDVALPQLTVEVRAITETQKTAADVANPVGKEQLTAQEWFERGYVFQRDKNRDEAIRCYMEAIKLDASIALAYYNLGILLTHLDLKRYEEAETAYRKAIELNPSNANVYSNLAVLLHINLKRYEEAEIMYRRAIELNPSMITFYNNLAILLRLTDRIEEARPLLEKMIEISPEDFKAYLATASIDKQSGKQISSELITKVRQFVAEDDWYNRACLETMCDNFDLAFEYLQRAAHGEQFNSVWSWEDPDLQWIRDDPRFEKIVGPRPE
jgi:tetratricopeptide (TPR) repeat protein